MSTTPDYWHDAKPILDAKCASCHTSGGIAPFLILILDDVEARAAMIRGSIASGDEREAAGQASTRGRAIGGVRYAATSAAARKCCTSGLACCTDVSATPGQPKDQADMLARMKASEVVPARA